jgi:hypothetical protein
MGYATPEEHLSKYSHFFLTYFPEGQVAKGILLFNGFLS